MEFGLDRSHVLHVEGPLRSRLGRLSSQGSMSNISDRDAIVFQLSAETPSKDCGTSIFRVFASHHGGVFAITLGKPYSSIPSLLHRHCCLVIGQYPGGGGGGIDIFSCVSITWLSDQAQGSLTETTNTKY